MPSITIVLVTPGGQVIPDVRIPGEYLPETVINELVDGLKLPLFDVNYTLLWESRNQVLNSDNSLEGFGVKNGDRLQLLASKDVKPGVGNITAELTDSDKTVRVNVTLPDVNTTAVEELDRDVEVQSLLKLLAGKHKFAAPNGEAASDAFKLASNQLKRILGPTETLRKAGIPKDDELMITQTKVAG